MASAVAAAPGKERFKPSRQAYADLFTVACGILLAATAGFLWQSDSELGINLNIAVTGLAGILFGAFGFYNPTLSRWASYGAGLIGLNAVLYYLTVYAEACQMDRTMTAIFWVSALGAGGLFSQMIISRAPEVKVERRETSVEAGVSARRVRTRIGTGSIVLYVTMTLFAVIAMIPFLWMISTSFMTLGETLNRAWLPGELQTCNYYTAWDAAQFNVYFTNSLTIALATIFGLLVVSILSAYAFAKINFYGRNVVFTLLLATLMVPEIVVMIPNYQTVNGLVFPLPIGSDAFPFFEFGRTEIGNSDPSSIFSWIDTLAVLSIPFMGSAFSIFLLRQFFVQIPHELWEAARIDGAGHLRFLVQIVVPISRPAILTVTLLTFIGSWNSLLWPLLVTRDPFEWRPIAYGLKAFSDAEAGNQTHLLMAGSFITILPMLVLYFVTQKSFTEGIATTGLKG